MESFYQIFPAILPLATSRGRNSMTIILGQPLQLCYWRNGIRRIARASRVYPACAFLCRSRASPRSMSRKAARVFVCAGLAEERGTKMGGTHGARSGFGQAASQWLYRGARGRKSGRAGRAGRIADGLFSIADAMEQGPSTGLSDRLH